MLNLSILKPFINSNFYPQTIYQLQLFKINIQFILRDIFHILNNMSQ